MPISSSTNKIKYNCDGSTTTFPFVFAISALTDIVVYLENADGAVSLLTDDDYTVSSSDYSAGGNVETTTAYDSGNTLVVFRRVSKVQSTDWVDGDALSAASIEDAIDKLTMQVQELYDIVGRCLKAPPTDDDLDDLPVASLRASKYFACDAEGMPTLASVVDPGEVSISAFAETLLDDANAATARTTLGEYDLIIDSNEDFELLENGAGVTYARVLVKAGTYTIATNIDLDDHGVIIFEGEGAGVSITISTDSGNKVYLGTSTLIRSMTIVASGANSGTDYAVVGQGDGSRAEFVDVSCTDAIPVGGFSTVQGGLLFCSADGASTGYYLCDRLFACAAINCVSYGFNGCAYGSSCYSVAEEDASLKHFYECTRFSGCRAYKDAVTGTDVGFYDCDLLTGCYADYIGGDGFNTSEHLSACKASACGGDGFESCNYLSACLATANTGSGFKTCTQMAACDSLGNGAADTAGAEPLLRKIVAFTAWNMDTTDTKTVAHGCTMADMRVVSVMLFNNAGTAACSLPYPSSDCLAIDANLNAITSTNIVLSRRVGGGFDDASYNAAYGYITIDYIASGAA